MFKGQSEFLSHMFGIAVSNYKSELEKKTANTPKNISKIMLPAARYKYFSFLCGTRPCSNLLDIKETISCNHCKQEKPKKTFSSLTKEKNNKNG